ncbi:MAG: hypothetical protein B7Z81_02740 [Acidocella sp. 20-61-6]|nr:MAG: hypothetical protein B7Z81_02740 [Acidocella sp. 20-61-6]
MKAITVSALVLLLAFGAMPIAHAGSAPTTIFSCAIGHKTVSVTSVGGQLTYHYGTARKDELTITGIPSSGNIFEMSQRFAGMEYQLRFKNGTYSYIVYDSEGNSHSGASATSGLVVMQGTKTIVDRSCTKFSEFSVSIEDFGIPEDMEAYSAM